VLVGHGVVHLHFLVNHLFGHHQHLSTEHRLLSLVCDFLALVTFCVVVVLSSLEASGCIEAYLVDD
jgi:hypothetical protein